ncbi:MAG: DUF3592 domain-containing protein [Novosphingobium sp.]|jgi:hypothetical protein|nr:DUF3592 domain-containing protein [Novosphingobium sp.]
MVEFRTGTVTTGAANSRLLSLIFLAGGIALLVYMAGGPLAKFVSARNWPQTTCEIIDSHQTSNRTSKGGTNYAASISYRYQAGGRAMTSDAATIVNESSSNRSDATKLLARYPTGAKVPCYVNPADPGDALLDRSFPSMVLIGLVLGLAFVGFGIVGLVSKPKAGG